MIIIYIFASLLGALTTLAAPDHDSNKGDSRDCQNNSQPQPTSSRWQHDKRFRHQGHAMMALLVY